jgi:hypothetical protein
MAKNLAIMASMVLILSGALFTFICYSAQVPGIYRIASQPTTVEGRVLEKQPRNRNHVRYAYEVGNKTYEGTGGVGERFDTIKLNDSIQVYYDPLNPSLSLLGTSSHHELLVQTLLVSAIFSIVMGSLVTLGLLGFRVTLSRRRSR